MPRERTTGSRRGRLGAIALVVVLGAACGCAYATAGVAGVAHPNPAPPRGHEVTFTGFAGASLVTAGWGGAGLSYAARIGDFGILAGGWGGAAGGDASGYLYGGSLEVGIPVAYAEETPQRPTYHFLVGLRLQGLVQTVEGLCDSGWFGDPASCERPPVVRDWDYLVPQLSLSVAMSPSRNGTEGGFFAVRLEGGPQVDRAEGGEVTRGQVAAGAMGGYRVLLGGSRAAEAYFTVQGGGRLMIVLPEPADSFSQLGAELFLALSFSFDFGWGR